MQLGDRGGRLEVLEEEEMAYIPVREELMVDKVAGNRADQELLGEMVDMVDV